MFVDTKTLPKFKITDRVKLFLKFRNRWVDYCPVEGVNLNDEDALWSFITFKHKSFYYIVTKPKFNKDSASYGEGWKEDYFIFDVRKFKLSDIPKFANSFNESNCIFKSSRLEFNDDALFVVVCGSIYSKRVDSDIESAREFRKFMKTLT